MEDFLNTENLNKQWIIMNIYNNEYNVEGLFPHWVKSAMESLTSGEYIIFQLKQKYKYIPIYNKMLHKV